ncbi:DUF2252 domain-containing protein [Tardiphaga sp. vice352]|uniref:DUF2252 domain-containing protein n=1 Tax=Tardiphaga sp. vice352 TaxID=2592816 RepID=UPI001164A442|nr:DUF2252 domain-containing protein [Tardiphaga sp. vice352]QDM34535.1 DUF2252 domain-containing protein [Tardiphaga sp. vice352]
MGKKPELLTTNTLSDRKERLAQGKALRRKTPREAHAELKGPLTRSAVAILAESDRDRVPELVPERFARMMVNPFAFLRGAAAVMASDLASQPIAGIVVHAGGDSHLMNFGAFVTPEDNILFDVNDFDETLPGVDFTVDLKRLAASAAVAALQSGASRKQARALAAATVKAYRWHMAGLARMSPLDIWHSRIDLEREIGVIGHGGLRRKLAAIIEKARGAGLSRDDNFPHLVSGTETKIVDKPPTIFHLDPKAGSRHGIDVAHVFAAYRKSLAPDRQRLLDRFVMKDLAFKAVGVGSVGTFCCVGLFMTGDGEPLFLQVKQAQNSVLERLDSKLGYKGNQGRRVVEGQQMMQAASDIFLGYTTDPASGRDFYIRTLKNRRLGGVSEGEALSDYAKLCGRTLARAHARSGDPAVITGYMGKTAVIDDAIASFAMAYANQTILDHAALVKAKGEQTTAKQPAGKTIGKPAGKPLTRKTKTKTVQVRKAKAA